MKRILGIGLLLMLSSVTMFAAKNSQTLYLDTNVQAGNVQITRGICEVTWSGVAGSQAQLTIKMENKKTVTIPARMVAANHLEVGTLTSEVNGVTHLMEIHTKNARFIIEGAANDQK